MSTIFAEMKKVGDGYAGGFSCGLTMHGNQTMEGFLLKTQETYPKESVDELKLTERSAELGPNAETHEFGRHMGTGNLESERTVENVEAAEPAGSKENGETAQDMESWAPGRMVYENHEGLQLIVDKVKDGECLRIRTSVVNNSDKSVTLEMLTSFGISGIPADRIHRLQSFWSAEGKLRTETIEELHLEPSWNRCGLRIEKFGNNGSMPVRKYFPFLALENSKTGDFWGVQLYLASTW